MPDAPPQVISEIMAGDALGMGAAARKVPAHRGEGTANPATVWRWIVVGAKNPDGEMVKLEAARVGGRWVTSSAAIARFLERLTPIAVPPPPPGTSRSETARRRLVAAANRRLEEAGC